MQNVGFPGRSEVKNLPVMQETAHNAQDVGLTPGPGRFPEKESSVQFSSVAQSCSTLCDPINRNTPGLPVHYQLPEFTQTHVH